MLVFLAHIAIVVTGAAAFAVLFLQRRIAARRSRGGVLRSLREVAVSFGAPIEDDALTIRRGGARVTAQLERPIAGPAALQIATRLDDVVREPIEEAGGYRSSPQRKLRGRPRIEVRKETRLDRIAERLWLTRRARSGDAAFDEAFWIASEAGGEDTRAALSDARTREAIEHILANGADQVTVNEEGALLAATLVDPKEEQINIYAVSAIADGLASAAASLPVFGGGDEAGRRFGAPRAVIAAAVAPAIAAPIAFFAASNTYRPLEPIGPLTPRVLVIGFAIGLAAWALSLPILALFARRHPSHLARFFASAASLYFALPILGAAAAMAVNGHFDASVVERPGLVHAKFGRPPSYEVDVPWWRPGGAKDLSEEVRIDAPEAADCVRNVIVVTGDGRLGSDWLRDIYCAPPVQDEAMEIHHVRYGSLYPTPHGNIRLNLHLRNDHDEPRWILVPTLAMSTSVSFNTRALGASEVNLERRGEILIAHFQSSLQRFIAVFMPRHSDVTLDGISLAHAYSAPLPKLLTINGAMARRLTFDGKPGEAWLNVDPLPASKVVLVRSSLPGQDDAVLLEIEEERGLSSEVIINR